MQIIDKGGIGSFRLRSAKRIWELTEPQLASLSVLTGFLFRWWSPSMRSDLWYDEMYSYHAASLPFGQMLHSLLMGGDTNPPLYTILLHFWLKLGSSDTHIKTLSLLFGLASIAVMFQLGKQIGGIRLAFIASFLLAVSDSAIRYSVEARSYALFLFLTLLSTLLLLSAIRKTEDEAKQSPYWRTWFWYAVVTTLAIYTHWFSLLLVPMHILGILIYSRFLKSMIFSYAVVLFLIFCCCLPLLPFLKDQIGIQNTVGGFSWCGKPSRHSLIDMASFLSGGKNLLVATLVIFLIAFLTARFAPAAANISRKHILFFSSYVVVPIILVATVSYSLAHYSFFLPRYFLPFMIGVQLLVAISLLRIKPVIALLFIVLFALSPLIKTIKHRRHPERPYSLLATELHNHSERPVLHLTPMSYFPTLHYSRDSSQTQKVAWSEAIGWGYVIDYNVKGEALSTDNLLNVDSQISRQSEFYVVRDFIDRDPTMNEMENHLRNDANLMLISEKRIGNISLELYRAN